MTNPLTNKTTTNLETTTKKNCHYYTTHPINRENSNFSSVIRNAHNNRTSSLAHAHPGRSV